jgi:hypothetical protein
MKQNAGHFMKKSIAILLLAAAAFGSSAQVTNIYLSGGYVTVNNTSPVPVTLTDTNSVNVWPSFEMGAGFGLTVCGFGWLLRLARKVTGPDNS